MNGDNIHVVTILVILAVVAVGTFISITARKDIREAFKQFCAQYNLHYSANLLEVDLPWIEKAWFLNIVGAYETQIRDVCEGDYNGVKMTHLKFKYGDRYAKYLSVFIFSLSSSVLPHTFLWTKKTRRELRAVKKWRARELSDALCLFTKERATLPPNVERCLETVAQRPQLQETRFEFLHGHLICVPHESFDVPDDSFENYLHLLRDTVRAIESAMAT